MLLFLFFFFYLPNTAKADIATVLDGASALNLQFHLEEKTPEKVRRFFSNTMKTALSSDREPPL